MTFNDMTTLFISDLHLQPQKPAITQAFLQFMEARTHTIDALYILGDLFEAWIGDDFDNDFSHTVKSALTSVTKRGIPVFFIHGNRDFLIGEQFAAETGCQILSDPKRIDLYGTPTLLMHGDTLCTEDTAYLKFRQMVRNPLWQKELLSKSIQERLAIAQNLREVSKEKTGEKTEEIMDVTQTEVERVMAQHQVRRLIHGHTHRPQRHQLKINDAPAERIVLGDWGNSGWVLHVDSSHDELEQFKIG